MPITLPKDPDGEQYEDYVVAALQALGYFVEPQLTLREGKKDVLELDVVATPSGGGPQDRVLYEVKKEEFSFSNAFKLFGQRIYLTIPKAVLVSLRGTSADYLPVYQAKGRELNVEMCHLPLPMPEMSALATVHNSVPPKQRAAMLVALWYGNIGRRLALSALLSECKARRGTMVVERPRKYLFSVRASFFQPTPLARAEALYNAYFESPKMSADAVASVGMELGVDEERIWKQVRDTKQTLWVQAIMDTEANGRLNIIKNAVDDWLTRGDNPFPTTPVKLVGSTFDVPVHSLPDSFRRGLDSLKAHPYAARVPYLFQAFYSVMGGYFFFDDDDEKSFLSQVTGIPEAQLLDTLGLLDEFFGTGGGGFFFTVKNHMLCMKSVPAFVRGTGAFVRFLVFGLPNYVGKYPQMGWLLAKWHSSLYGVLEPHLHT